MSEEKRPKLLSENLKEKYRLENLWAGGDIVELEG
jgi:ribosomal silencing factor RsfS